MLYLPVLVADYFVAVYLLALVFRLNVHVRNQQTWHVRPTSSSQETTRLVKNLFDWGRHRNSYCNEFDGVSSKCTLYCT